LKVFIPAVWCIFWGELCHFGNKHEIFANDSPSSVKKIRIWGPLEKMQDGRHFQDGRYLLINISMNDIHFYRAMLCIRGTSHGPVSVCLSQAGILLKRQKRRITQTTPHDTTGSLVF